MTIHTAIPIIATIPHDTSANSQPKPAPMASGTERPEAKDAMIAMDVVYTLVICPTLCGNFSLITAGNSTFIIAIPAPTIAVPINNNDGCGIERMPTATKSKTIPNKTARSFPIRRPIFGASGLTTANAMSGRLVISPALQFSRYMSSRMVPSNGPTEVIAGLRLKPATIMAIKYNTFLFAENRFRFFPVVLSISNPHFPSFTFLQYENSTTTATPLQQARRAPVPAKTAPVPAADMHQAVFPVNEGC